MAKINEEAATERPLNDERIEPKKVNRHVVIALNHLNKRRDVLIAQRSKINAEVEEIDTAILALE